jgi:SAM-dependent methyltransferase
MSVHPIAGDPITISYDDAFRRAHDAQGEIYGELSGFPAAAHVRRMELLGALDVGDLATAVAVDYGVGPWGFAAVFPRLRECRHGIGIDISAVALEISREVERGRGSGERFEFRQSRGDVLPLDDASVDLLFAGESIEHVDMPEVFLDEVRRVLRPGGQLVLTTPNSRPASYLASGDEYGIGPEHIALMTYDRLAEIVAERFDIVRALGYNTSLHFTIDETPVLDEGFRQRWARQFEYEPSLATGVVVHARSAGGAAARRRTVRRRYTTGTSLAWSGQWTACHLHEAMWGRWADDPQAAVAFTVPDEARTVALLFWAHDWSGEAVVVVDGEARTIDLFSAQGGIRRLELPLRPGREHAVEIRPAGTASPRSNGRQVILFAAFDA